MEYFLAGAQNDWRITLSPWVLQLGNYWQMPKLLKEKTDWFRGIYDRSYNGFVYYTDETKFEDSDITDRNFSVQTSAEKYFDKLADLCNSNDITLILIQAPVSHDVYYEDEPQYRNGADQYLQKKAEEYNITYWNFNSIMDIPLSGNFIDRQGHMYGKTAEQFSALLGSKLAEAQKQE